MKYKIKYTDKYDKSFKKLDKPVQKIILKWIKVHLYNCENPRLYGKALTGNLRNYWRYRVGNYRIIAEIKDNELIVLVVDVGHRRKIYN